jgi:cephalosporin hydroxylase
VGIHPYPLNELMLMTAALCVIKPTHIFEWGTHVGKSARIFYEVTKHFNITCEIHSIDLPDNTQHKEHPQQKRGLLVKNISEIKLHQGDGLVTSLSLYKNIFTKSNPLFFLDGDHDYYSVKCELKGIIKNISNASILIHDTFYQSIRSKYNIGPYRAVRNVLKRIPNKYKVISTNIGLPGITLLYENRNK